jgi:hypothetical protein
LIRFLFGRPLALPQSVIDAYPELREARWRRGGLPLAIAAIFMRGRVAGVTLWRWVFLDDGAIIDPGLLLHEFRHVHQFQVVPFFPLRYIWETARQGYQANRFEVDARQYAAERQAGDPGP